MKYIAPGIVNAPYTTINAIRCAYLAFQLDSYSIDEVKKVLAALLAKINIIHLHWHTLFYRIDQNESLGSAH